MSLAQVAGKVSKTINGSNLGNALNRSINGNSQFLRNHARGFDRFSDTISSIQNTLGDLSNALGIKDNMYVIGRYENDYENNLNWKERTVNLVAQPLTRAISYLGIVGGQQTGVIIDGFDNFRGDISVALPDNPVMYSTSVTDQVVRNPNRVSMRVYVDLMHSDDIFQNILQSVKNSLGGLAGTLLNVFTGEKLNRAQKALEGLQYIQEFGHPFKVYTPHKVYENMMIEKIAPINDQKMNEILAADITFKEIVPTTSLGYSKKTTARVIPSSSASTTAKVLGWIKG